MAEITSFIDIAMRISTLFLCVHQFNVVYSKTGEYCVKQEGVLKNEGRWLNVLIATQFLKIAIFTLWNVTAVDDIEQKSYDVMKERKSD